MSNTTFRFAYSSSPLPLLLCKTQSGKEFFALVDTGSEITLIDNSLKDEIYPSEKNSDSIVLHSMHGEEETVPVAGTLKTTILDNECKEQSVSFDGIMNDLSSIADFMKDTYNMNRNILAVIGSDYLNRNCAVIDCEAGTITL